MSDTAIVLVAIAVCAGLLLWFVLAAPSTEAFERMLYLFDSLTGKDAAEGVDLRSAVDAHTFTTSGGSLVTYFVVRGARRLIGEEEAEEMADRQQQVLGVLFGNPAMHSLALGFRSDPGGGRAVVKRILEAQVNTALRFGVAKEDLAWLMGDKLTALSDGAVDELAVLALYSHHAGLSQPEKEKLQAERIQAGIKMAKDKTPGIDARVVQSPLGTSSMLMSRHEAACRTFRENMEDRVGLMLDMLTVEQASTTVRRFLDSRHYAPDWHAKFAGTSPAGVAMRRSGNSADGMLPPPLARQILSGPIKAEFGDLEFSRYNGRWYAPLVLEVPPQEDPVPWFTQLASSLSGRLPWQMSMELLGDGLAYNKLEKFFASIMGAAGDHNKRIAAGYRELKERMERGDKTVAVRALFYTWGDNKGQCADRLNTMRSVIESWGHSVVSNEVGSPDLAHLAAAPAFSRMIPAPYLAAPMSQAVRLLPLARPASVYDDGQIVAFTKEGQPYPIRLGHPGVQQFWGVLIFAPTGSGKSFLLNMVNSGGLFSPGLSDLPLATIVDFGPSGRGVVEYAKAVLPPEKARQIEYWRPLPDDMRFACNPLDTHLMCDRPTAEDLDYGISVVNAMCPSLGPEGSRFIAAVLRQAYEDYGRGSVRAKRWQWTLSEAISQELPSVGLRFDEEDPPFVWEVVDAFFKAGRYREAQLAQYHAVPTIPDLAAVVGNERIQQQYGELGTPHERSITKAFLRNIQAAADDYGLLCTYTRHDADVRFKVIDIKGLASSTDSEQGRQRFGVMALFARRLGARDYFLTIEDLQQVCPPHALGYHRSRLEGVREQLKFLEYDEVHNMRGVPGAKDRLERDAREGRKYFVVCVLSSQELEDFPRHLVNQCTNFFIMGCANGQQADEIATRFDLTRSERDTVARELVRPGRFFFVMKSIRGTLSQMLYTRPGPVEKWAFTTAPADAPLRDAVCAAMGPRNGLTFLAMQFPQGNASAEIDNVRKRMGSDAADEATITRRLLQAIRPQIEAFCLQRHIPVPDGLVERRLETAASVRTLTPV